MLFVLEALLSGVVVAIVSEVAKRSPALGALIVSLPLVSILSIVWLWAKPATVSASPTTRLRPSGMSFPRCQCSCGFRP